MKDHRMKRVGIAVPGAAWMVACGLSACGGGNGGGAEPHGDAGGSEATTGPDDATSIPDSASPDAAPSADGGADAPSDAVSFTITLGPEHEIADAATRAALGFKYGLADGVIGAVADTGGK